MWECKVATKTKQYILRLLTRKWIYVLIWEKDHENNCKSFMTLL